MRAVAVRESNTKKLEQIKVKDGVERQWEVSASNQKSNDPEKHIESLKMTRMKLPKEHVVAMILVSQGWISSQDTLYRMILSCRKQCRRLRDGIPPHLRASWWINLAWKDQTLASRDSSIFFHELLENHCNVIPYLAHTGVEGEIRRDLFRTFPQEDYFDASTTQPGHIQLANILKALSKYYPDIGYCQGMNYVVGKMLLLWHQDCRQQLSLDHEEEIFWIVAGVIQNHQLDSLWAPSMPGLRKHIFALQKLIDRFLPQLASHLRQIGMHAGYFATQAGFVARIKSNVSVFSVWNLFLVDGLKLLFRIALVLLSYMQADLLQLDMEEASNYFVRHPKGSIHQLSGKQLLHEAMKFKVTRTLLSEIEHTRKLESLQYRLTRTSFSNTDAVYYPELDDRPEDAPSDLDPIRSKLASFDSTVAQDVTAFRDKIEKLEKALEKSSETLVNATRAAMDASYQLEELMEWHDRLSEQIHQLYQCEATLLLPASSNSLWYYRVFGCFDHEHSVLHDADEGEAKFDRFYYHKKLAQVTRNLASAQSKYKETTQVLWHAQLEMEERHHYKKKLMEQFWTVLQQTQAAKGQMLLGLFQQLDQVDRNTT